MQLDRIELNLRRRHPWEAIDLGLVMLRQWHKPVYLAWLSTFIAFAALTSAVLWQWPMLVMFIVWWLKPLFDRILLKVFAEATFGAPPSIRDVWRALPGLIGHTGLFSALTFRRFNPHRSFDLPIWQLEGQRGKGARNRRRVLSRKTAGYAFWLTFVCTHFIVIFEFGLVGLVSFLTPGDGIDDPSLFGMFFGDAELWQLHLFNVAWLVAETIVEPFYIAAGFSLYINRRSDLEGWDIEVAFRRMAAQHAHRGEFSTAPRRAGAISLLILACLPALLTITLASTPAMAQEASPPAISASPAPPSPQPPSGRIKKTAETIVADPVFGREVEELSWQPKKKENKETSEAMPPWIERLAKVADWLAFGLRGIVYAALAVGAVALMLLLYRNRHRFVRTGGVSNKAPSTLFGLDLRPDALPDNIPAAAHAELDAGRVTAALSLLYRGALVSLIEHHGIEFAEGDTEGNCLSRVKGRIAPNAVQYFGELLDAWTHAAYAAEPPAKNTASDLCQRWATHFSERKSAA
ncbi:DUF4129 domain-containing protein [Propionivibrio limicola]|uniref:DUF4129 domain-containing protein n=1 Tax=Propionivibrio limicola TaxID=167645 RepID=UPI0012928F94|nr:DUF4129 domain-containing protein [Propionivibrio limicola]